MPDVTAVETEVRKLQGEIDRLSKEAVEKRTVADRLADDARKDGFDVAKLSSDQTTRDMFDKIDEAYKEADLRVDQVAELRKNLDRMYGWTGRTGAEGPGAGPAGPGGRGPGRQRDSIGSRLAGLDTYQSAKRSGIFTQDKAEVRLNLGPIMTREELRDNLRTRAGLDLASGQAMVTPEFALIPPIELPVRQVRLLDLIDIQTTDTDAVVWGQQTQRVLAAAPTASGVNAPQATMAFQRQTAMVRRIPVLLTIPKEVLADEGRMQGILDKQLLADARLTVESQVLAGGGTGEDFEGILNTAGIGSTPKIHLDYDLDVIHRGITYVRLHLFEDPDGIGVHPTNLEGIMLQKDNYGRYIFEPSSEQSSIWGFPAISTPVFAPGTGVVGNWRMGATLWLREDVVLTATDGYTDTASGVNYFSAGLVAVLAQVRAAFATERPFAFCEVTGLGTAP